MPPNLLGTILSIVGGVAGGVLGYHAFFWITSQGFYALVLPGALIGLGASLFAKERSVIRGIICAVAALILGLYTEWSWAPFKDDDSFGYLVTHFFKLKPITLLMIGLGTALGYWMGKDARTPSV